VGACIVAVKARRKNVVFPPDMLDSEVAASTVFYVSNPYPFHGKGTLCWLENLAVQRSGRGGGWLGCWKKGESFVGHVRSMERSS
jgi:hypothetical protein